MLTVAFIIVDELVMNDSMSCDTTHNDILHVEIECLHI